MSEIPSRLRRGTLRGVVTWDGEAALLEDAGVDLAWHTVLLDTAGIEGKEEFLQVLSGS